MKILMKMVCFVMNKVMRYFNMIQKNKNGYFVNFNKHTQFQFTKKQMHDFKISFLKSVYQSHIKKWSFQYSFINFCISNSQYKILHKHLTSSSDN